MGVRRGWKYGLPRAVVGWVHNHARENYWRVAAHCELDDLIQDGLLCAVKCMERYGIPGIDIDAPHFMALVKSTFYRYIGELLRQYRGVDDSTKIADVFAGVDETTALDRLCDTAVMDVELVRLVAGMPAPLRNVVEIYLKTPEKIRQRMRVRLSSDDETMSERLYRLAGFPPDRDFETDLRVYLWHSSRELVAPV